VIPEVVSHGPAALGYISASMLVEILVLSVTRLQFSGEDNVVLGAVNCLSLSGV